MKLNMSKLGAKSRTIIKPSAFGGDDSSDEDETPETGDVKRANNIFMKMSSSSTMKVPVEAEDASIYDYDAAYDSIKDAREKEEKIHKAAHDEAMMDENAPQSRYIGELKGMADVRNREKERVFEKKLQEEQKEEEVELGGPTERFVTTAYKAKLAERQQWETEALLREKLEQEQDVRKTGMGSAFYSNVLGGGATAPSSSLSSVKPPPSSSSAIAAAAATVAAPVATTSSLERGGCEESVDEAARQRAYMATGAGDGEEKSATPRLSREEQRAQELEAYLFKGETREAVVAAAKQRYFVRKGIM